MADELTPKLDADGNPEMDADGNPIMEKIPETQPKLDADGNPIVDADGNPVLEAKPVETPEDLSWLDTKKYGSDIPTAIKKQAQAYHEAQKRMQQAINEGNSTKKEIASMKATLESLKTGLTPKQPVMDPNNIPDGFREQVRLQFGDGVTAEQVIMQQKLLDANLEPLRKDSLTNNWKLLKADLKADSVFGKFPELLEQVEALPLAERLNEDKIKQLKADFITEHISEIMEQARLDGAESVTGSPPGGQTTETSTKKLGKKEERQVVLSAEHKQFVVSHGCDPNDAEEYLNRKPTDKKRGYLQVAE